jgi:hypothetical protein
VISVPVFEPAVKATDNCWSPAAIDEIVGAEGAVSRDCVKEVICDEFRAELKTETE